MKKGLGIPALLIALLFLIPRCAAAQTIEEDIQTLTTPASPGMKIAAANRLGSLGKSGQWPEIVAALTHQSKTGDEPVRDAARAALAKLIGPDNLAKLVDPSPAGAPRIGPEGLALPVEELIFRAIGEIQPAQLDSLLDPEAPLPELYSDFLRLERAGLDSTAMRLLLYETRNATGEQKARAEWALWCLLGPEISRWAIQLGATSTADSFVTQAKINWVDKLRGGEGLPLAAHMLRSPWPELRELGEAALLQIIVITSARPGEENVRWRKAAEAKLKPIVEARIELEVKGFTRAIKDKQVESELVRSALAKYDHENPQIRASARRYWEMLVDLKTKELDHRAQYPLIGLALGDPDAKDKPRIIERLDHVSATQRIEIVKRLAARLLDGNKAMDEIITRWKLDKTPDVVVAREFKRLVNAGQFPSIGSRQTLRNWLELANGPDAGSDFLATLLHSENAVTTTFAARLAMLAPERYAVIAAVIQSAKHGKPPVPAALAELKPLASPIGLALKPSLSSASEAERAAALTILVAIGVTDAPLAAELEKLLRSKDREERHLAARALGTEDARRIVRTPEILQELRDPNPRIRSSASHEARRLGMDMHEIMGALVRAVDTGNLPVREGLTLALERAWAGQTTISDILAAADQEADPTARAYLRAARRAIGK